MQKEIVRIQKSNMSYMRPIKIVVGSMLEIITYCDFFEIDMRSEILLGWMKAENSLPYITFRMYLMDIKEIYIEWSC